MSGGNSKGRFLRIQEELMRLFTYLVLREDTTSLEKIKLLGNK